MTPSPSVASAAVFTASRVALATGPDPRSAVTDVAGIARRVVRRAQRQLCIVVVRPGSLHRVDGWLDDVGVVTHVHADGTTLATAGCVVARASGARLLAHVVDGLVDGLPAAAPCHAPPIEITSARALPAPYRWVAVVSSARSDGTRLERTVLADADGLVGGRWTGGPVAAAPIDPDRVGAWFEAHLRLRRSVADLVGGD